MFISEEFASFFPHTDGKFPTRCPSVTRVLSGTADKTFLEEWKNRVGEEEAERIARESAEFGDKLHTLIENRLFGINQEIPKGRLGLTFRNLCNRLDQHKIETIGIELPMQSLTMGLQGRVDFIGRINNELCIVDWKSKKNLPVKREWIADYFLQATAYALMFREATGYTPKKLHIILANETHCQWETHSLSREWAKALHLRVSLYRDSIDNIGGSINP